MANEPERPIEKLLRAAAQKRRDQAGAPLELHPVNRRLLQDEVTRVFPKAQHQSSSFASVLLQMWPRFAGGLAILAVLGMAVWLMVPWHGDNQSEALLAKNLAEPQSSPVRMPSSAVSPPPATLAPSAELQPKRESLVATLEGEKKTDFSALAQREVADEQMKGLAGSIAPAKLKDAKLAASQAGGARTDSAVSTRKQINGSSDSLAVASPPAGAAREESRYAFADRPTPSVAAAPAPAAAPEPVKKPAEAPAFAANQPESLSLSPSSQVAADSYGVSGTLAKANRSKQTLDATDGFAKAQAEAFKESRGSGVTQSFVLVGSDARQDLGLADKSRAAGPVLASFKMEQEGNELRVIDNDGSVYKGRFQVAAARRSIGQKVESATKPRPSQPAQSATEEQFVRGLDADRVSNQSYSFQVTGTNRSLNKRVVFTGSLLTVTNLAQSLPALTNVAANGALGGQLSGSGSASAVLPLRSRISGKVVVSGGRPVEINAVQSNP